MAPWPTESTRIWASVARSSASLMGQPLPHERGRGRVRGGNRKLPPATPEGGTRGKRSFPPRDRAAGEGRSSALEADGRAPRRRAVRTAELVHRDEEAPEPPDLGLDLGSRLVVAARGARVLVEAHRLAPGDRDGLEVPPP